MLQISDLSLPPHVRACASGEWIVLLDLMGDRYWALPGGMDAPSANRHIAEQSASTHIRPSSRGPIRLSDKLAPSLRIAGAALWAHAIVRRGRLQSAFTWIEAAKQAARPPGVQLGQAHAMFVRRRPWIPKQYVCLFDSLCLARFLIEAGHAVDLVLGVRTGPFAAHCWVEAHQQILDEGGQDCASFIEIARV